MLLHYDYQKAHMKRIIVKNLFSIVFNIFPYEEVTPCEFNRVSLHFALTIRHTKNALKQILKNVHKQQRILSQA